MKENALPIIWTVITQRKMLQAQNDGEVKNVRYNSVEKILRSV